MAEERGTKLTRRRFLGISAAAVAGTAIWQWNEVDNLTIERQTLKLKRWKADGFRIAVIGDLHANTPHEGERAGRALQMAIDEKPDAVLMVGDFIHKDWPETLPSLEKAFAHASGSKVPIYAAMGNHDYWVSSSAEIVSKLRRHGIKLLRNEIAMQDGVTILGIDDGLMRRDRHDTIRDRHDSGSVVAMFHEPDFVERVDKRIGLMLAGHSHGGQICLPFGIAMHTPGGARKYKKGFYDDARVPLYVTRGIGTIGPRKRAFCSPEISVLTLVGGAEV